MFHKTSCFKKNVVKVMSKAWLHQKKKKIKDREKEQWTWFDIHYEM